MQNELNYCNLTSTLSKLWLGPAVKFQKSVRTHKYDRLMSSKTSPHTHTPSTSLLLPPLNMGLLFYKLTFPLSWEAFVLRQWSPYCKPCQSMASTQLPQNGCRLSRVQVEGLEAGTCGKCVLSVLAYFCLHCLSLWDGSLFSRGGRWTGAIRLSLLVCRSVLAHTNRHMQTHTSTYSQCWAWCRCLWNTRPDRCCNWE